MLLLALLAVVQDVPQPGPIKAFGDWAVACDNGKRCEMTSLLPGDDPLPENGSCFDASLSVVRAAGPAGGYAIEISFASEARGRMTLRIDDAAVASAAVSREAASFGGADAARIVAAMANGKRAALADASGRPVACASLAGSSAALRFIDAEQGRAGTVTAAVARGAKPASAVPAARPVPRVAALRPSGSAAPVSRAMRATMEKASGCDGLYDGIEGDPPAVETHALGGGRTLALLPCGAGAYNFSTVAFIVAGGKAVPAAFDLSPGEGDGVPMLVNAGWDAARATLSSYAKGRGVGDCGTGQDYVWDGRGFRLVAARTMTECRGSTNWLTVWRATPVLR